jgi:hypothetical protein
VFPVGATSATIAVPVLGDALNEPDETFVLNLTGGNVVITDGQGQATIVDDDPDPEFRIDDAVVTEGNAGPTMAVFTVTMAPSGQAQTVDYQAAAGTAIAGVASRACQAPCLRARRQLAADQRACSGDLAGVRRDVRGEPLEQRRPAHRRLRARLHLDDDAPSLLTS